MDDERDQDKPEQREEALLDSLNLTRDTYRQAINDAVDHALFAPADRAGGAWAGWGARNIGGRIRDLVQNPKDPSVFYAGSAQGGVYCSRDGGDTWQPIGEAHDAFPVGALAIAPSDPNVVYVGSGEPGVKHRMFLGALEGRERFPAGLGFFRFDAGAEVPRLVEEVRNVASSGVLPMGAAGGYARIVVDPRDPERCWIASNSGLWRREAGPVFLPEPLPGGGRVQDAPTRFEPILSAATRFRRLRGGAAALAGPWTITSTTGGSLVTAAVSGGQQVADFLAPGDIVVTDGLAAEQARVVLETVGTNQFRVGYRRAPVTDVRLSANWSPGAGRTYRILAAVGAQGIYRGVFDPGEEAITWQERLQEGLPEPLTATGGDEIDRVRLAASPSRPAHVYAVYEKRTNRKIFGIFHSADGGDRWTRRELTVTLGSDKGWQAWVNLVCEVHPDNPALLLVGAVELARSKDFGRSWERILNRARARRGDPAQHSDQHAAIFDVAQPQRLWIANDGGVAMTTDIVSGNPDIDRTWRKRSHGILAAQFNEIAVHPSYPFLRGGGLQDNGTYSGVGGESWFHCGWGDGGQMTFPLNNPRDQVVTSQSGLWRSEVVSSGGAVARMNLWASVLGDLERPNDVYAVDLDRIDGAIPALNDAPFVGQVIGFPHGASAHLLAGRDRGAFVSTTGGHPFTDAGIPTGAPAPADQAFHDGTVSALAYDPSAASGAAADWWVGTTEGQLFRHVKITSSTPGTVEVQAGSLNTVRGTGTNFTTALVPGDSIVITPSGGGTAVQGIVSAIGGPLSLTLRDPLAAAVPSGAAWFRQPWTNLVDVAVNDHLISRIVVHPANRNYVVFATAGADPGTDQGRVFLSADRGLGWREVTGLIEADALRLPPCPITSLVFDPSPAAGDPQILYAGTLAGVYVLRNLPPANTAVGAVPAFAPRWLAFNGRPVTPARFDPPLAASTNYLRLRADVATNGAGSIASDGRSSLVTGSGTSFRAFFQPGDLLRTRGGGREQERQVAKVVDDTHLLTRWRTPPTEGFSPVLPAGTAYSRQSAADGSVSVGTGSLSTAGTRVTGAGTAFKSDLRVGDILLTTSVADGDQARVVVQVEDDEHLVVAMTGAAADRFSPALAAGTAFNRDLPGVVSTNHGLGTVACTGVDVARSPAGGAGFTGLFATGDMIHVTPPGGGTQSRIVAAVASNESLTVTQAFAPDIAAGAVYARSPRGVGRVAVADRTVTGTGTDHLVFFRPGDSIHILPAAGGAGLAHTVEAVQSSDQLTLTVAVAAAIPAGAVYARGGFGRGSIQSRADSDRVTGSGTAFTSFLRAGDILRAGGQARVVAAVVSDTELRTAFRPPPEFPLVLVKDLALATYPPTPGAAPGSPASVSRHRLVAATYGRGMLETDIPPVSVQPTGVPEGGPRQRLFLRQYSIEDGLDLPRPSPALLNSTNNPDPGRYRMNGDPRTPLDTSPFAIPPTGLTPFSLTQAFDIRVDNAPFQDFGEVVDGVDFDESLRTKALVPGRRNVVYVQAHNRGWGEVSTAWVHLYVAVAPAAETEGFDPAVASAAYQRTPAGGGTVSTPGGTLTSTGNQVNGTGTNFIVDLEPGDLITVGGQSRIVADIQGQLDLTTSGRPLPDLQADFWSHYLKETLPTPGVAPVAPAAAWQRVGSAVRLQGIAANKPSVARFDWVPPATLDGKRVALLALLTSAEDPLPAAPPTELWRLILRQRRAALRVVQAEPLVPDFYLRDGNEDDGRAGSVAYSGRSPDILVEIAPVPSADLRTTFRDLSDPRRSQKVKVGAAAHVYVRVFNRLEVEAEAEVEVLWTKTNVPTQATDASAPPFQAAKWQRLAPTGLDTVAVPPRDWAIASLRLDNVPNPDPGAGGLHAITLIALVRGKAPGDPRPVPARIHDDPNVFHRFFLDLADSNNAAMRVVKVEV